MAEKQATKLHDFTWEGTNKSGARVTGEMTGISLPLVKAELRRQGIVPLKVKRNATGFFGKKEKKIASKDVSVFTRQLSTMIAAGIPLAQSFDIIGRGHENPSMRKLIMSIKTDIESGTALAESLEKYPKHFNALFCNLVAAGEQSGSLETMLNRLALYKEKTESLKKKIKKALTYPIVVLTIAFGVSAALLIFVVPQFEAVFKGFGAELPQLTQYVVKLSGFMQSYWWIVLGFLMGGIFTFRYYLAHSEPFAFAVDRYLLRFPIIGAILTKAVIARYARTLATTFAAGMPLVDALNAVSGATGNRIYTKGVIAIRDQVTQGTQLQQAMKETGLFPNMVVQMVAIGEESGALEIMLNKIAEYYEELVDNAVDNLSTLMEPLIMCVLGVIIGGMVVAMYLPIFQLGGAV